MIGEELERDYFEDRQEKFAGLGDINGLFYELLDVAVAFNGDCYDTAAAGGYFLNV